MNTIKVIDLFSGMGGMRIGFTHAARESGFGVDVVFSSEIKPSAVKALEDNFPNDPLFGDITQIPARKIPDFNVLLAGFPCQSFSTAGSRKGFGDIRGTLFFYIDRILAEKKPDAFILENVEGLVTHDRDDISKPIGRTLKTILLYLDRLGYKVSWKILDD